MFNLKELKKGVNILASGWEVDVFSDTLYGKGYKVFDEHGTHIAERSANAVFGTEVLSAPELNTMNIVMSVGV